MTTNTATAASTTREATSVPRHIITATAGIAAPPERVYAIIANYRDEHPRILPPLFTSLEVEKGGIGAGTVIKVGMRIFGRAQSFRAMITEPEPGRVLVETDLDPKGPVTTFIVDSGPTPGHSRVTFTTELKVRSGFLGKIERLLSTRILRPTYLQELDLLAARATGQ